MKKAIIIALATVTLALFTTACGESEADKLAKQEMKAKAERTAILEKCSEIAEGVRKDVKGFDARVKEFDKRCIEAGLPKGDKATLLLSYPDFRDGIKAIMMTF